VAHTRSTCTLLTRPAAGTECRCAFAAALALIIWCRLGRRRNRRPRKATRFANSTAYSSPARERPAPLDVNANRHHQSRGPGDGAPCAPPAQTRGKAICSPTRSAPNCGVARGRVTLTASRRDLLTAEAVEGIDPALVPLKVVVHSRGSTRHDVVRAECAPGAR
jgi:hypothetical protein